MSAETMGLSTHGACNWRTRIHSNVVLTILHIPWNIYGRLSELDYDVSLSSNRVEKVLNSINIWWMQDLRVQRNYPI